LQEFTILRVVVKDYLLLNTKKRSSVFLEEKNKLKKVSLKKLNKVSLRKTKQSRHG